MAQFKDIIVDGTAKFNGDVEFTKPVTMTINGNATTAGKIKSIQVSAGNDHLQKYFCIGKFSTTASSWSSCFFKIAFTDSLTSTSRAVVTGHARHNETTGKWDSSTALHISDSTCAEDFHLIMVSDTEIQLWVKISTADYWEYRAHVIYNENLTLSNDNTVYDALPEGTDIVGTYDIQQHTGYGVCNTASGTAEKAVTISDRYWDMKVGSIVTVKFGNTNTANNPTLNVNGTGAKPIIYNSSSITTSNLVYAGSANRYIQYVYTGSSFVFMGWSIDNNTTYGNASETAPGLMSAEDKAKLNQLNVAYGTCTTAAATAEKTITIDENTNWKLTKGAIITVKFTATNTAANPKFNVNGTGAKPVIYGTASVTTNNLTIAGNAKLYLIYTYDGTGFVFIGQSAITWRGIQDNLNSTSTTDSLSANQGKILKEEIDKLNEKLKLISSSDSALQCINGAL